MMDFTTWFLLALGRASLALSISAVLVWALLRGLNTRTASLHQIAWGVVLLQGWLLAVWSVDLPASEHRLNSLSSSMLSGVSALSVINAPVSVTEPAPARMPRMPWRNHSKTWRPACWPLCLLAIWVLGIVAIMARSLWQYWDFMRGLPHPQPAPADLPISFGVYSKTKIGIFESLHLMLPAQLNYLCWAMNGKLASRLGHQIDESSLLIRWDFLAVKMVLISLATSP